MRPLLHLPACALLLLCPAIALAQKPKLDEVLKSINESSRGQAHAINWTPLLLLVLASILIWIAIKHWNRRQAAPKSLNNHTKLLKEAASASGLSVRQLKTLEGLARSQGMSSPLVALLCPSSIAGLAKHVKTEGERKAVGELAKRALKP
jgi:hypothetical protein